MIYFDAMAIAYKLFALSLLLKSFILLFLYDMATLAQCTNQDSNSVYAGTNLTHMR